MTFSTTLIPPKLEQAFPGSVSRGNGYLDALGIEDGSELEFLGSNFGGVESNTTVLIDGEECPFRKVAPGRQRRVSRTCRASPTGDDGGLRKTYHTEGRAAMGQSRRFGLTGARLSDAIL